MTLVNWTVIWLAPFGLAMFLYLRQKKKLKVLGAFFLILCILSASIIVENVYRSRELKANISSKKLEKACIQLEENNYSNEEIFSIFEKIGIENTEEMYWYDEEIDENRRTYLVKPSIWNISPDYHQNEISVYIDEYEDAKKCREEFQNQIMYIKDDAMKKSKITYIERENSAVILYSISAYSEFLNFVDGDYKTKSVGVTFYYDNKAISISETTPRESLYVLRAIRSGKLFEAQ